MISQDRTTRLLEATDELETYLQAKLDTFQRHGIELPAEEYDEEADRCLMRLIEAMQAVTQLLLADQQAEGGGHG
jgi:hypothetical protein